jgi:hypothetical protein
VSFSLLGIYLYRIRYHDKEPPSYRQSIENQTVGTSNCLLYICRGWCTIVTILLLALLAVEGRSPA